jgi:hypothetical protein
VRGTYNGLFGDSSGLAQDTAGAVTISVTTQGKFSGRLQFPIGRFSFTGQFAGDGSAQVIINRRNAEALVLNLQIDPQDSDHIYGNIGDSAFSSDLSADRAVFDLNNTAAQAGKYTLSIPGFPDSSYGPGGNSYGIVTVDRFGRIKLGGALADSTPIVQSTQMSKDGYWPLFIPLYRGQGGVFAWININPTDSSDLTGDLTWSKPVSPTAKYYPAGFEMQQSVVGSQYFVPTQGSTVLNLGNANLYASDAGLDQPVDNPVTLNSNNKIFNQSGSKMGMSFSVGTGTFSGFIFDPATSHSMSFRGVVLQRQNVAVGFFLNPTVDQSGPVVLQ